MLSGELRSLDQSLKKALAKTGDTATRYHLEDARDRVDVILNPEKSGSGSGAESFDGLWLESAEEAGVCWPDLIIKPN